MVSKVVHDDESKSVSFLHDGEDYKIPLVGLDANTLYRLAGEGIVERMCRRKYPLNAWKEIQRGELDGKTPQNVPQTVKIIAELEDIPIKKVWDKWRRMTKEERKVYTKDPRVVARALELKGATEADLSLFVA